MTTVRTESVTLPTSSEKAFAFLADIENAPKWATEFIQSMRKEGDRHWVTTPGGELLFALQADPGTGVIDMLAGPSEQQMALFPARVVPLPDGTSAFVFTILQQPGQTQEQLESDVRSLRKELLNIAAYLRTDDR